MTWQIVFDKDHPFLRFFTKYLLQVYQVRWLPQARMRCCRGSIVFCLLPSRTNG